MKLLHFVKPVLVLIVALSAAAASFAAPVTYYVKPGALPAVS